MGDNAKRAKFTRFKKKNAKQEINKDDARGYRKRKVNAARIKAGKPTLKNIGEAKKQDDRVGQLISRISDSQRKKPY